MLLLHGSPGSHRDFATLGPALGATRRVIAPDLPGFGASSPRPPGVSLIAHAANVEALLEALEIDRAHVLGFSMGGGVGLELAERDPRRVADLVLLSSLGVVEHELLGDQRLNHAVHQAMLVATRAVDLLAPHFGAWDRFPLGVAFARNFAETDQRRLRPILESWPGPALVLHGRADPLVPLAAARESARLMPQSELVELEADHFLVFGGGEQIAALVEPFLARVESGTALTRPEAEPQRVELARRPSAPDLSTSTGALAILVVCLLLAVATLVTEDLTCVAAGLMVAQGRIPFLAAVVGCAVGIFVGDVLLFAAGRTLGRAAIRRRPLSWWLDEERLDRASRWFVGRGPIVILASRFTPGARLPTYLAAGMLRTPWLTFTAWFALSVALWTPLLVGLATVLGERAAGLLERGALAFVLVAATIVLLTRLLLIPLATYRGRRRLLARWRRLTQWEFWPSWALYPPIVLWILWLGLRHRGLTLFTAVNPAFPAGGGFAGESKRAILELLPNDPRVPAWRAIPPGAAEERLRELESFLRDSELALPIVVKPDVGERGEGVWICRTLDQALAALVEQPGWMIAQEYLPGIEIGAFWTRMPGEPGRIFAVTDKRVPEVVGDGVRTCEELVLADRRALILAETYLANLGTRRDQVPSAGERVPLTELGTHCRGAIFLDGMPLLTPALADSIADLSNRVEGFDFGRWDLRAADYDALARGEVRVVELNGVTSEATSLYDPRHTVVDAWCILGRQWRMAFEIGAANRARGIRPATLRELARLGLAHLRRRRV